MAVATKTTTTSKFETNSTTHNQSDDHRSDIYYDDEHVQSLDPGLQLYLSQISQQMGCWSRFFPIPFERAASKSWWDPIFDSEILEEQYRKSSASQYRSKFRYAIGYMVLILISWMIYFFVTGLVSNTHHWPLLCSVLAAVILSMASVLFLTYTRIYNYYMLLVSLAISFCLCIISLSCVVLIPLQTDPINFPLTADISPVGHFAISIEILMIIYTLIPLKLYMSITIGALYSIIFEVLTLILHSPDFSTSTIIIRLLSHTSIHLIGLHILIMTNVHMRNTFMKVGQSLLVRRQLESEKRLKENMIHSLMPPSVAKWLLNDDENFTQARNSETTTTTVTETSDIRSLFRPFNMNRMENVSILFADIVGFTKMASNKTAEQLVEILNVLFQRFDSLCQLNNCEKISTLGDCYYCVSGCPDPRPDHAKCCVEMGLGVIQAIKQFCSETKETVNMRVGIHTGTVLCGIVGTRRFKFDVWSNDVTLANRMESTGKPGMVHISEKTYHFIKDLYVYEDGQAIFGMKTFFVLGRREDRTPSYSGSFRAEGRQKYTNSLHLFVSPPSTSPSSSVSPQSRPRVLSCDTSTNLLKTTNNPNMLSPDVCKIKANSLPSILDSENEQQDSEQRQQQQQIKTPTSTASSGKYSMKLKNWKMPKFLRKTEQEPQIPVIDISSGYQQVPTIIETNGRKKTSSISIITDFNIDDDDDRSKDDTIYFDDPKDNVDVKSYISQSRSDIGQYDLNDFSFMRSGSYRSHQGRSPNDFSFLYRAGSNRSRRGRSPNFDLLPTERARSATVAAGTLERPQQQHPKRSLDVPGHFPNIDEFPTTLQSWQNRKDSGIKSNSRRSSIQQIDIPTSSEHRVSGYYTSSQSSSVCQDIGQDQQQQFYNKFGTCIQNLRKQSDRQLIRCVQDNLKSRVSYFITPSLQRCTLLFKNKEMEKAYRETIYKHDDHDEIETLANSHFNVYFNIIVSTCIFLFISISLLLLYDHSQLWLLLFAIFLLIQLTSLLLICLNKIDLIFEKYWTCISKFYCWHLFGCLLISLPMISVLINYCSKMFESSETINYLYTYLLFVSIIHFCIFTQLNCWIKNLLVTLFVIVFIPLFLQGVCLNYVVLFDKPSHTKILIEGALFNKNSTNFSTFSNPKSFEHYSFLFKTEILMDLFLLLVLVWMLNREFEIGYRISFHASYTANRDRINVQRLKNQADYLIYNIVPEHVAEQLKKNAKYSENFKKVGIIFASIVNFNEMYDESYHGGKEFLRVLNELIGDFDELLDQPQFRSVEKIKTIGSTFMAASGLNSELRLEQSDPHQHLYDLMDFAIAMQKVIDDFNRDLLEFNLILRIGYNFGDVTAAVIGNTKLYYDIWGDAVNVASRMDSTGVNGHIQVEEKCLPVLDKRYVFQSRGSVYVKGKDHMNVYLLRHKKTEKELKKKHK